MKTLALLLLLAMPVSASAADALNFNKASAAQLAETLDGIVDQGVADAIVAYREANGPFQQPEDLLKVPGMRPAMYNEIKPIKQGDAIVFEDNPAGMHSY